MDERCDSCVEQCTCPSIGRTPTPTIPIDRTLTGTRDGHRMTVTVADALPMAEFLELIAQRLRQHGEVTIIVL